MKRISTALSVLLCAFLILIPLSILKGVLVPGESKKQDTRVHAYTGNTTRISANTAEELSLQISRVLYPSVDTASRPDGYILLQSDGWQDVMALLPLSRQYNSPILLVPDGISPSVVKHIIQTSPKGIPQLDGISLLLFGSNSAVLAEGFKRFSRETSQKSIAFEYKDVNDLVIEVNRLTEINDKAYGFVLQSNNPLMSIPAASWIVNQGGALLFTDETGKLYPSSQSLLETGNLKKLYITGKMSDTLNQDLKNSGAEIQFITADTPEQLSIRFAEFYDPETHVGWNATLERSDSGHNFILSSTETPMFGILAAQLAYRGKPGPIIWTESDRLSPSIENYMWKMKPNFWVTPAEGPFNHTWIVGDTSVLNYKIQSRVDFSEEIQPYEMLGEQAISGLDVLSILSALVSLGGAVWIAFHLFYRMKRIFILTKMMWILLVLLSGPLGIWLYIVSYKDRPWMLMGNNIMWKRPLWNQAAVATATGLAFGASAMLATAYMLTFNGLPLVPLPGLSGLFLLGNPMIILFIIVYIVILILNCIVFIPTMLMRMRKLSYREAVKNSIPTVFISVTSVVIGLMTATWWLRMAYLPMMPEEEYILWWGTAQAATVIGGLTAYIPNWRLVRHGRVMGTS